MSLRKYDAELHTAVKAVAEHAQKNGLTRRNVFGTSQILFVAAQRTREHDGQWQFRGAEVGFLFVFHFQSWRLFLPVLFFGASGELRSGMPMNMFKYYGCTLFATQNRRPAPLLIV